MRHLLVAIGMLLLFLVVPESGASGQTGTANTGQKAEGAKKGTHGGDTGGSGAPAAAAPPPAGSSIYQGSGKPRIAVLEFSNKANNQWWFQNGALAAQDVFVTELVKSRKFVVIEREKINAIVQEKGLTLSGDIDTETAMKIGKLLGVNYMLTGAVTEYGNTGTNAHGTGMVGAHKREFVAALNARLINVSTGEIVWANEARKSESSTTVSVGGFGGGVQDDRMFDKMLKPIIQELVGSLKSADF